MRDRPPDVFGETAHLPIPDGVPEVSGEADPDSSIQAAPASIPARSEYDPLRLCIYTTIGLIAWLITPPLTIAIFGTIGVVGYWRARRRGLVASRCLLGDTRLVIAYLAVAALGGTAAFVLRYIL